jgi:hypothetical protein
MSQIRASSITNKYEGMMEDNVYQLPGTHGDEDFICPGCLAEGVIADTLENEGVPAELVPDIAMAVLDALFAADLL